MTKNTKILMASALFVSWALFVALLVAGLLFSQRTQPTAIQQTSVTSPEANVLKLDAAELAKHSAPSNCWLMIQDKVYDVTSYLNQHPGGASAITPYCGGDATIAFATRNSNSPHSSLAAEIRDQFYIGDVNQVVSSAVVKSRINASAQSAQNLPGGGEDDDEYDD